MKRKLDVMADDASVLRTVYVDPLTLRLEELLCANCLDRWKNDWVTPILGGRKLILCERHVLIANTALFQQTLLLEEDENAVAS